MRKESSRTHDVFLSYSSQDKTWADSACAVLERHRVRCWIAPRDITPGDEWGAAIIKGLNGSRMMVLIFSGHANASEQVRREVERAISQGMTVLPVRVEDVLPEGSMEFALGNRHWLDAFTPPVERKLELLARSVKTLLGNEVEPVAAIAGEACREGGRSGRCYRDTPATRLLGDRYRRLALRPGRLGVIIVTIKTKITVPDVSSIPVDRDGKIVEHDLSKNGPASNAKPTADASGAKPQTPTAAPETNPPGGTGTPRHPRPRRLMDRRGRPARQGGPGGGGVEFGDGGWTDYDLTFEACKDAGTDGFGAYFRVSEEKRYWLIVGGLGSKHYLTGVRLGIELQILVEARHDEGSSVEARHDPAARMVQAEDLLARTKHPRGARRPLALRLHGQFQPDGIGRAWIL